MVMLLITSCELLLSVMSTRKAEAIFRFLMTVESRTNFIKTAYFPHNLSHSFPLGIGGPEDARRSAPVSLKRHVKHLFKLADSRFQENLSFVFTAFNILQHRELLLHSLL